MTDSRFVITGTIYRGEYPIDLGTFTGLEWSWIKKASGYYPMTIDEGIRVTDVELITVLAVIAIHRAGKLAKEEVPTAVERLLAMPFDGDSIRLIPAEKEQPGPPLAPAETPATAARSNGTGGSSPQTSESPESLLETTGALS